MIHVVIVIIAVVGPIVPIISTVTTGGYTVTSFPPVFACFASNPAAAFYPFVMVLCIALPIGFTLILLTIWKLFSVSDNKKKVPACMKELHNIMSKLPLNYALFLYRVVCVLVAITPQLK